MELAIDTSTAVASVALAEEGRPLAEITWQAGQRHSATLLPQIQYLLHLQHAAVSDLKAIAIALGPGSFNGLRTGLGTAKGLCLALELPLIGIGTLEATAYPFAVTGRPVCPVQEAGRGEVAAALFQHETPLTLSQSVLSAVEGSKGEWRCLMPPQLVPADELPAWAPPDTLFCLPAEARGEIVTVIDLLRETRGPDAVLTGATAQRRAAVLAEIAWQRLTKGEVEDLDTIEPLYLRRPAISQPRVPIRTQEA